VSDSWDDEVRLSQCCLSVAARTFLKHVTETRDWVYRGVGKDDLSPYFLY